jgi:uncharacterized protein (DUF58 family)
VSKSISKGVPIKVNVKVTNDTIFPVANVVLMFEYSNSLDGVPHKMTITVPSSPKSTNTVTFNLSSQYCGIVDVRLYQTKVYDNLKMFCLKHRHQSGCSVLVMPKFHNIPMVVENVVSEIVESDTYSKDKAGDDCSEVFDIREYQDGDRLNRIHWKLSSKGDQTYVKEYSLPISNSVVIIPEMVNGKDVSLPSIDTITELLLSISQNLNAHEVNHGICIYSQGGVTMHNVTNDEETLTVVGSMVRQGIPEVYKPYAFSYFQSINEYSNYSHTIYITNVLDVQTLSNLEDFNSTKKTVFYVSNQPMDKKFLSYDGVQVVQVVEGKILECVSEFIV